MSCVRYFLCIWFKWKITGILPILWNTSNFSPGKNWSYIKKWFQPYLQAEWPGALTDDEYKANSEPLWWDEGFHQGSEGAVQQNCFWISLVLTVFFHPHFLTYHDHRRGPFLGFDLVFLLIDGRRIFFHCISGQLKKLLSFYDIYFFFCDYFEAYKM